MSGPVAGSSLVAGGNTSWGIFTLGYLVANLADPLSGATLGGDATLGAYTGAHIETVLVHSATSCFFGYSLSDIQQSNHFW